MPEPTKAELRAAARARRRGLAHPGFATALAANADMLGLAPGNIVGGYHALPDEADPSLLLARLAEMGCHIAFPRVVARNQPLIFHRVPDGEVLRLGAHGIHEPLEHWPAVTPDLLLVPLLAFDADLHRLGYGGGYYDRTLAARVPNGVRAVGVAFAGQKVDFLPHDAHDWPLDAILTEQGLLTR